MIKDKRSLSQAYPMMQLNIDSTNTKTLVKEMLKKTLTICN